MVPLCVPLPCGLREVRCNLIFSCVGSLEWPLGHHEGRMAPLCVPLPCGLHEVRLSPILLHRTR